VNESGQVFECVFLMFQAQLEARRRRIETENTVPLGTDVQTNAVVRPVVDKNCNATPVEQVQQQGWWSKRCR
jgi:hypothetical protein